MSKEEPRVATPNLERIPDYLRDDLPQSFLDYLVSKYGPGTKWTIEKLERARLRWDAERKVIGELYQTGTHR